MELSKEYIQYFTKVNGHLDTYNQLFVKLMNTKDEQFIPTKKHLSDAGYDCRARLEEPVILKPGQRACIPLGFAINIPLNHTGDLRPRSGLTKNHGVMVGYGTIDAGYTGEVKATVFNLGEEDFTIHPGDRIAQLVILPIVQNQSMNGMPTSLIQVQDLVELERGENGHGSTGIK